jgi:phosphoketolase
MVSQRPLDSEGSGGLFYFLGGDDVNTHRRKWEKYYNRKIEAGWEIHHKDHNHDNNDIDNLFLIPKKLHIQYHTIYNVVAGNLYAIVNSSNSHMYDIMTHAETLRNLADRIDENCGVYSDMVSVSQLQWLMSSEVKLLKNNEKDVMTSHMLKVTEKYLQDKYINIPSQGE